MFHACYYKSNKKTLTSVIATEAVGLVCHFTHILHKTRYLQTAEHIHHMQRRLPIRNHLYSKDLRKF